MNCIASFRSWVGSAFAASLVLAPALAWGDGSSEESEITSSATRLPEVSVSATRGARLVEDVPARVTIITADDIEKKSAQDIRGLVRDEPGVSVQRAPARFSAAAPPGTGRDGNAGFNIRGIGGNRVLIQSDGIRIPDAFSFGATNIGRGDYLDLSAYSHVEILRGAASALYGSDGLAGAVSFYTKDPADLLGVFGKDRYASATLAYAQEDHNTMLTLSGAQRAGAFEAMAVASLRNGGALDNQGTNDALNSDRTRPNPQDTQGNSLLAKFVYNLAPHNRIKLALDHVRRETETEVYTNRAKPPLHATSVLDLDAVDTTQRDRITLSQELSRLNGWAMDKAVWNLYYQDARARQISREDRNTAADRVRDNLYQEKILGFNTQLDKAVTGAPGAIVAQQWVYGFDASRSRYAGIADGVVPPAGESFPVQRFPETDYNRFAAYVQDELVFLDSTLVVIPALRYDRYSLEPKTSPQFPGTPVALSDSAVTPKLGVLWKLGAGLSTFANLAQGFRAPMPSQVNQGFANLVSPQPYQSIGNPNLKPETNRTAEIGLRGAGRAGNFEVVAFQGKYKDFIESTTVGGNGTPGNPTLFQFVNLGEVTLSGFEAKGRYELMPDRVPGLALAGGFSSVRGTNETRSQPLNSVDPARLVLSLSYDSPGRKWGGSVSASHAQAKDARRAALPTPPATQFLTPSYTTLDLSGFYRINPHLGVTAGIFNLTDKKIWHWSDVQGVPATATFIDAYTQPGRNVSVALKAQF